jgi:hypothetical protein
MSSNVGKKCFKLWCVLCAQHTLHATHRLVESCERGNKPFGYTK